MKKGTIRKNKFGIFAAALCMSLLLTGCGSSNGASDMMSSAVSKNESYESVTGEWGMYEEEIMLDEVVDAGDGSTETVDVSMDKSMEEKLIRTVDMTVETKEYDQLMESITQEVKKLGGYIENMDSYNGSMYSDYRSSRSANMTLRIPKDKLDGFLESVSAISNVTRKNEGIENVTLQYVDLESHKKALETEYNRLLELLEKAESIEDIITIESRLSSVRYQMESMESQLRTLDNQVDYSTVYLNVEEVIIYTPVEEPGALSRITEGFKESVTDIIDGAKEMGIYLIIKLPYLVLWTVIIGVFVWLVVRSNRKQNKKKKEKEAQMNYGDQNQQK